MDILTKMILKEQGVEWLFSEGDKLRCDICGREVTIDKDGKGPLICCGEPMDRIVDIKESGFKKMPKGWTKKSVKKFANTLATTHEGVNLAAKKGFFDKCISKMTGKVSDPEGFCAAVKDQATGSTFWRGKDKSAKQVNKQIKQHQNVK